MIGRNDPCPCGSGKKFKKCCLSKECDSARQDQDSAQGTFNLQRYTEELANRGVKLP
jgi:hypothetical protein